MYTDLFDTDHRVLMIDLRATREKAVPSGEYESDILCKDCEAQLSKLETYARIVLFGGNPGKRETLGAQNFVNQHGVEFTHITGLNYKKFKLFLLSILWRSSISKRPFFSKVDLGPYEEKIRIKLLSEDPGPSNCFPCVLSTYRKHNLPVEVVGEPRKLERRRTAYSFLINGILYHYYITHKCKQKWVLEAAVNESGDMRVLNMPEMHGKKILNSFMGEELFK